MKLTKHHGLANDFLVGHADELPADPEALAQRVCDRRLGIGADGLLFALPGPNDSTRMVLFNADGSRPEMSGNGIRCLAQAVAARNNLITGDLLIHTDGGQRVVSVSAGSHPDEIMARVDMGPVGAGPGVDPSLDLELAGTADLGNPHLVVHVADTNAVDVAGQGSAIEALYPDGLNVEFISPAADSDTIDLVVWERGVGVTQACGTGACAAATLASRWGLVGDTVTVRMPGGNATVEVGSRAFLTGPAVVVGTVEVNESLLHG